MLPQEENHLKIGVSDVFALPYSRESLVTACDSNFRTDKCCCAVWRKASDLLPRITLVYMHLPPFLVFLFPTRTHFDGSIKCTQNLADVESIILISTGKRVSPFVFRLLLSL